MSEETMDFSASAVLKRMRDSLQNPVNKIEGGFSMDNLQAVADQGVDAPHFPLFQDGLSSSCVQSWAVAAPQRAFRQAWGNYPRLPGAANLKGSVRRLNGTTGRNIKPGLKNRGGRVCFATQPVIQPGYFTRISTGLPRRDESTACFVRLPVNAV